VLVFAQGEKIKEAEEAGADYVGGEELAKKIEGGWLDFDSVVATPDMMRVVPCIVTVFKDRTFEITYKTPPASVLLKKYANVVKGAGTPNKEKVGTVTKAHLVEIAKIKIKDMNASSMETAIRSIEGTARNMGIKVEG